MFQEINTRPIHILVAEDNMISQKIILRILKDMGYTCSFVNNGREVLNALEQQQYDFVFMDVNMPLLDGYETTRRIIETYGAKRPVIIAMTASVFEHDKQLCFDAGMDDFMSKPADPNHLSLLFDQWKATIAERR